MYSMYKSLRYINTDSYNICSWWNHAHNDYRYSRKNRYVVKVLLNVFRYDERQCPLCEEYVINDIPHVLFKCGRIKDERERNWNKVMLCAPHEIIRAADKMNDEEKAKYILNACHCEYVPECKMLFDVLSDFIYNIYLTYKNECDRESTVYVNS